MTLDGKVIAIIGASSGMGAETARLLASEGASVALGARRADHLKLVQEEIQVGGGSAITAEVDIRSLADVERLLGHAITAFGRLDVVVVAAGDMGVSLLSDLRVEEWMAMVDTNVKGALNVVAAALPILRAQASGHFVFIASAVVDRVSRGMAVYAATKSAVKALADGLRQECAPDVRVTLISPGLTNTEGVGKGGDPKMAAALIAQREAMAMPPDAVARAIAFAIDQPDSVDVAEIVVRSSAQR